MHAKSVGDTRVSAKGAANRDLAGMVLSKKIDDRHVTRNNLSIIRDLALHVFEAGSKTCNAKTRQKIVREPMLHGINF